MHCVNAPDKGRWAIPFAQELCIERSLSGRACRGFEQRRNAKRIRCEGNMEGAEGTRRHYALRPFISFFHSSQRPLTCAGTQHTTHPRSAQTYKLVLLSVLVLP